MARTAALPADIERRLNTLGQALAHYPAIVFAYLFGSGARGKLGPLSDVDVAVYLDPAADIAHGQLEAMRWVTGHLGTDRVDLVVLNTAPTALAGRILASRRVIVDREPFLRHRYESVAIRKFFDLRVLEHRVLARRVPSG